MARVALYAINTLLPGASQKALTSPEIAGSVWKKNLELAEQANEPGKFTAFCVYEWTSMPNSMNVHRGILAVTRRIRLGARVERRAFRVAPYAIGVLAAFWCFERLARFQRGGAKGQQSRLRFELAV